MNYAQKIRDLRIDRDLTQAQIAQLLNTSKNQIGKYERGEQELPIRHLIALAQFYNVSTDAMGTSKEIKDTQGVKLWVSFYAWPAGESNRGIADAVYCVNGFRGIKTSVRTGIYSTVH